MQLSGHLLSNRSLIGIAESKDQKTTYLPQRQINNSRPSFSISVAIRGCFDDAELADYLEYIGFNSFSNLIFNSYSSIIFNYLVTKKFISYKNKLI